MAADTSDPPPPPEVPPSRPNDDDSRPMRQLKPLPRRRWMIDPATMPVAESAGDNVPHTTSKDLSEAADQLAEALSTSMAIHSQYAPLFDRAQDPRPKNDAITHKGTADGKSFSFHLPPAPDVVASHNEEYREIGLHTDYRRQPENKKKRKVPGMSRLGEDVLSGEDDLADALFFAHGRRDLLDSLTGLRVTSPSLIASSRVKLTRATKAALVLKELLKSRKRQLTTVLGALSHGDTFALDQALSTTFPLAKVSKGSTDNGPAVRRSRRHARRRDRVFSLTSSGSEGRPPLVDSPSGNAVIPFAFRCESAISDRLRATKNEIAFLHDRFEAEFSRQAARATELAKEAAALASKARQRERYLRRDRSGASGRLRITDNNDVDKATGNPFSKSKKKKRSALANESNPHHLRNYVPSRLPNSSQAHQNVNARNNLGVFPLRFLSADIPPTRGSNVTSNKAPFKDPNEEWICALCEYKLFYGESEHERRRAVRNRKQILSRRRRAIERAAAAAAGTKKKGALAAPLDGCNDDESGGDDFEDVLDGDTPDRPSPSKRAAMSTQQERDRDKEVYK